MAPLQETVDELRRENEHLFDAFAKESDRGLALVTAEFFDATLERLLRARFAPGLRKRPKIDASDEMQRSFLVNPAL